MNRYDDVLLRMKEYKKKAGFTQEKMGSILGVKQEQYCYIQKGIFKLSDRHLMALHNLGWSVDYLITGQDFANDFQNVDVEDFGEIILHRVGCDSVACGYVDAEWGDHRIKSGVQHDAVATVNIILADG